MAHHPSDTTVTRSGPSVDRPTREVLRLGDGSPVPTERAFTAAQRLRGTLPDDTALRAALVELGFHPDEAQIAINALAATGSRVDRWSLEGQAHEDRERGYMSLLFSSVMLAGGILTALLSRGAPFWLGLGCLAAGAGAMLMLRGALRFWRARGV